MIQDPSAGTLVHFHGNGETVADYVPEIARLFATLGLNLLLAEYRGYGASTGQPALGAMLDDVEAVFQATEQPEEKVILFGRSVGSIYAIELAQRHPGIAGLVIESGIADPLERILLRVEPAELGVSREDLELAVAQRLDHRAKLATYEGPLLTLHAAGDSLVLASHAERLHDWASGEDKKLVLFPRGDHNSVLFANAQSYMEELGDFVTRVLPTERVLS
ncbi:MAG TPA: alpha/beta hydrolase [Deltaproteobacteria bacterium]|nr:alpha/beta hydrolase [Deltaproteobacteria bacterium]